MSAPQRSLQVERLVLAGMHLSPAAADSLREGIERALARALDGDGWPSAALALDAVRVRGTVPADPTDAEALARLTVETIAAALRRAD